MIAGYEPERIRRRIRAFSLQRMFRIVRASHVHSPLDTIPAPSRFSDPDGTYAVLYAAETLRCCFWEAVIRNRLDRRRTRTLPRSDLESRHVVEIRSVGALNLVDLSGDGPIRIAAPTAVTHDANHAAARVLSSVVYRTIREADGFAFRSRFTSDWCVAVFDRALDRLSAMGITPLVRHRAILDTLDTDDIVLTSPR